MPTNPKIPKPYRRKNHRGKEQGSYYCKVRGEEINLATKDPDEAWRRAAAAKRDNKRNFKEDADAAADAAIEARTKPIPPPIDELAAARAAAAAAAAEVQARAETPPSPAPQPVPAPAASPPPSASAPAGSAPPTSPPQIPVQDAGQTGHERVEEAAREATQERDTAPPPGPQPPPMQFDPAFLAMLAKQGATTIVELQLMLQGWIVFKRTGDKPGAVPREAVAGPIAIWEHQLKIWIARWELDLIPPWAVALFLTTMCYPLQSAGRTKKPPAGNLGSVQDAEWTETPFRKAA
jgi:hypothetical protein